jgi:hypothetical protein
MCLVVFPLTFIDISICMNKSSPAVGLVVLPVSFVTGSIKPDLNATAIANIRAFNPFTLVFGTIFKQ